MCVYECIGRFQAKVLPYSSEIACIAPCSPITIKALKQINFELILMELN